MALQANGKISLSDIATEFEDAAPHALSEFYGVASGIPTSDAISLADFYGASNLPPELILFQDGIDQANAIPDTQVTWNASASVTFGSTSPSAETVLELSVTPGSLGHLGAARVYYDLHALGSSLRDFSQIELVSSVIQSTHNTSVELVIVSAVGDTNNTIKRWEDWDNFNANTISLIEDQTVLVNIETNNSVSDSDLDNQFIGLTWFFGPQSSGSVFERSAFIKSLRLIR